MTPSRKPIHNNKIFTSSVTSNVDSQMLKGSSWKLVLDQRLPLLGGELTLTAVARLCDVIDVSIHSWPIDDLSCSGNCPFSPQVSRVECHERSLPQGWGYNDPASTKNDSIVHCQAISNWPVPFDGFWNL